MIIGITIFLLILGFILAGLKVASEWERVPVLRLGRFVGFRGPGLFFIIPIIENSPFRIDTRIQVFDFKTDEKTLTKDNVPVNVGGVMYVQPIMKELNKVILNVADYKNAVSLAAQTTLRETIGKHTLQDLLGEREKIGFELKKIIDQKTEKYGLEVHSVEIKEVEIPQQLQDAIARVAEAERERQARVILSQAEVEAADKMVTAAKKYDKEPGAMELRWMNQIHEVGLDGKGTIIIIPADMPIAGVGGILGLKKMAESKKNKK